jgi:hypothetical protein
MTLSGLRVLGNSAVVCFLFVVSSKRGPLKGGSCLKAFSLRKPFLASCRPQQSSAREGELQPFTLRVTRRTVPIMLQASERRSSAGKPSLLTVRIFQSLEDALRDAGGVALQAVGEVTDQLLRLRRGRVPRLGASHVTPR